MSNLKSKVNLLRFHFRNFHKIFLKKYNLRDFILRNFHSPLSGKRIKYNSGSFKIGGNKTIISQFVLYYKKKNTFNIWRQIKKIASQNNK